jgi:GNAT superfamily N-acetyltransferase
MIVRPAHEGDVSALARLMGELGYPTSDAQMTARFAVIAARDDIATFVAELDGAVVGMISVSVSPSLYRADMAGAITALVVLPEARGHGTAPALMAAGEQWLREHGCEKVSVQPSSSRTGAHRFYEKLGYANTGIRFTKSLT